MTRTLSKKLADVKPGTLFIGVDLGLDRNVAVVTPTAGSSPVLHHSTSRV